MAQQERPQAPAGTVQVLHGVAPAPAQISHRLLFNARDPDRGQLPRAVEAGEASAVTAIGLHPVPGRLGYERGGHHDARDVHALQQPVQLVARRPCLVASGHVARLLEPVHEPPDRRLVVEDPLDVVAAVWAQRADRDRVLVDVHPEARP